MNQREALALKRANIPQSVFHDTDSGIQEFKDLSRDHIKDARYTVTVGDICFVAIGQITNRPYQAARFRWRGFVVVNSPSHDAKLAEAVRAPWAGKEYRHQLLASLLADFHTRGEDERGGSDRIQIGAAIRLLYYFPSECGPIVANRLRELDLRSETLRNTEKDYDANGLYADHLLGALTVCKHEEVRRELVEVFRRTGDLSTALAVLPAISPERSPGVAAKLKLFVIALPETEDDGDGEIRWRGKGYSLLKLIGERFPDQSADIFREYLKNGSLQRRVTVCRLLREDWGGRLAGEILMPLLKDDSTVGKGGYRVEPNSDERLPVRVCDEAALTIVAHRKDLTFKLEGRHEELDRQIEVIRKRIQK
jgi:hypothetical protein